MQRYDFLSSVSACCYLLYCTCHAEDVSNRSDSTSGEDSEIEIVFETDDDSAPSESTDESESDEAEETEDVEDPAEVAREMDEQYGERTGVYNLSYR